MNPYGGQHTLDPFGGAHGGAMEDVLSLQSYSLPQESDQTTAHCGGTGHCPHTINCVDTSICEVTENCSGTGVCNGSSANTTASCG